MHKLFLSELPSRDIFALKFLARMELGNEQLWKNLWTEEVHSHLTGYVSTRNGRILATENTFETESEPFHLAKVTYGCGFTASFIIGPYFFVVSFKSYNHCRLWSAVWVSFAQPRHLSSSTQSMCGSNIFYANGAPPHIANPVKLLLKRLFENARNMSHHFPTTWPSRSPDLDMCDLWVWGYLKNVVFSTPIA